MSHLSIRLYVSTIRITIQLPIVLSTSYVLSDYIREKAGLGILASIHMEISHIRGKYHTCA
jgi:hypothetical protein